MCEVFQVLASLISVCLVRLKIRWQTNINTACWGTSRAPLTFYFCTMGSSVYHDEKPRLPICTRPNIQPWAIPAEERGHLPLAKNAYGVRSARCALSSNLPIPWLWQCKSILALYCMLSRAAYSDSPQAQYHHESVVDIFCDTRLLTAPFCSAQDVVNRWKAEAHAQHLSVLLGCNKFVYMKVGSSFLHNSRAKAEWVSFRISCLLQRYFSKP